MVNLHQRDLRLPADKPTVIDYHAIKTSSSLYLEGFTLVVKFSRAIYGSLFRTVLGVLTVAAILFWIYPSLFSEWLQPQLFEYDNDDTSSYFTVFWPQVVALGFVLVWPISRLWRSIAADADDQMGEQNAITYLGDTLLLFPLTLALAFWWVQFDDNMLSVFNFEGMYSWWWSLIAPFFLLLFYDAFIQRRFFVASIPSVWPLWTSAFGAGAGMCMLAYLAAFLISWLVNSFLLGFVFQFISLNLSLSPDGLRVFNQAIEFILDSLLLTTWVSILCGAFASWYYSRIEANDARGLIERIDQIGLTPQIQGLRRE